MSNLTVPLTVPLSQSLRDAVNIALYGSLLPNQILPPSGFGWSPSVKFFNDAGVYSTDYDPAPFLIEGSDGVSTYYVDVATGLDTNPGTSGSPFKSIYKALLNSGRYIVRVKGGTYNLDYGWKYAPPNATDLQLVSWDGAPVIVTNDCQLTAGSWTLDSGTTYWANTPLYTSYRSQVYDALTPDSFGDYNPLKPASSLANCRATAGTYWGESVTDGKVYVNNYDGRAPDSNIKVYNCWDYCGQFTSTGAYTFNRRLYVENFRFEGGAGAFGIVQQLSTYLITADFKNCTFKYGGATAAIGGVNVLGNCIVGFKSCTVAKSGFDGFSYQSYGAGVPKSIEDGCSSRYSGTNSTGANQNSTMHNGGKVVRVNGTYAYAADDQVADVNADTRAWNLGCTLGPKGSGSSKSGAQSGNDASDCRMWFDGCVFTGLDYGWGAASGGYIYYKNQSAPSTNPSSTGTIATY